MYYYRVYHKDMSAIQTVKLIRNIQDNGLEIVKITQDYFYIEAYEEQNSIFLTKTKWVPEPGFQKLI